MPQNLIYINYLLIKKSPDYSIRASSAVADFESKDSPVRQRYYLFLYLRTNSTHFIYSISPLKKTITDAITSLNDKDSYNFSLYSFKVVLFKSKKGSFSESIEKYAMWGMK